MGICLVGSSPIVASESDTDKNLDGTINELYDYLLQREYAGHVEPDDHQMERKAVRSPSLRLRFGRRSDPSIGSDKRIPSTRLRWGKRDMPIFFDNGYSDEVGEPIQRLIRAPSLRLRFGRSVVNLPKVTSSDETVDELKHLNTREH